MTVMSNQRITCRQIQIIPDTKITSCLTPIRDPTQFCTNGRAGIAGYLCPVDVTPWTSTQAGADHGSRYARPKKSPAGFQEAIGKNRSDVQGSLAAFHQGFQRVRTELAPDSKCQRVCSAAYQYRAAAELNRLRNKGLEGIPVNLVIRVFLVPFFELADVLFVRPAPFPSRATVMGFIILSHQFYFLFFDFS